MSRKSPHILLSILLAALPVMAQDAESAKSALDSARKAAGEAGVKLPDIKQEDLDKLLKKATEELAKAQNKQNKEKAEKLVQDATMPNVRIDKLPDWIPAIPGFTPVGQGRQWDGEKFDNGKIKGTAALVPAALADAWLAHDGKGFAAERNTRTVGQVVTEKVRLTKSGEPNVWAEFSATPGPDGPPTQVRVTYSQPAPKDRPAPKSEAKAKANPAP